MAASTKNKVRIIAGTHRSRQVSFPDLPELRPSGDRVRETLFNWLQLDIAGATCLDLFAGSGILGMEAISRGASWVDFVDANALACKTIQSNLQLLEMSASKVHQSDAIHWLGSAQPKESYDLVFLDPPFSGKALTPAIELLESNKLFSSSAKLYIESGVALQDETALANWKLLKEKKAGQVLSYLFCRTL